MKQIIQYILLNILLLTGCAGYKPFVPPAPFPDDRRHIPEPAEREYDLYKDYIEKQASEQVYQALDFSSQLMKLSGNPREAYNVDAFDEVANSSWYTNRNAMYPMTVDEIVRGPLTGDGPDTTGAWTIIRAKAEGVTPGFTIRDPQGDIYVIKFDPADYPELASGTSMIGSKLFHAAGYHVPEDYITWFLPERLVLGEKVKFTDPDGIKRMMTEADLEYVLDQLAPLPNGRIRAIASKYVPGKPVGPFAYMGLRRDDPNDILPHEHRRELRGLYVMSEWLKNVDSKSGNTLDSYVTVDGRSYVRHYVIDFGTILGSGAYNAMDIRNGHENTLDPNAIALNFLTLGLYVRDYEKKGPFPYKSIGTVQSEYFRPNTFKPMIPNPAFEARTDRDCYWGAKQVMSFTDDALKAVVDEARYSDPDAARYMLRVLVERRDKIGRYWFSRINPLERFHFKQDGDRLILDFTDLAVSTGLETAESSRYQCDIFMNGNGVASTISSDTDEFILPENAFSQPGSQWELVIRTWRDSQGQWLKPTRVYVERDDEKRLHLIGLKR